MSERERIINLLERVPDNELSYIIGYIQGLTAKNDVNAILEIEPDEWDLEMIAQAEKENDGEEITLDDFAAELGIAL